MQMTLEWNISILISEVEQHPLGSVFGWAPIGERRVLL
jgi:hypothetical protein